MAKDDQPETKPEHLAALDRADNSSVNLKVDPNDPRRVPPAETGFSLNKDDPEQKPKFQNPVK